MKMKILRFQKKRLALVLFFIAIILFLHYHSGSNKDSVACGGLPEEVHKNMVHLIKKLQSALDALHISYFLCYGSLWGALKLKGPLPWQKALELCVLNKDLSNIDELFLARTFKRYGLSISYNIANGIYTVLMTGADMPVAKLTVFEEDSVTRQMRRVGWTHRLLPPNACQILHCFPPDLILPPLEEFPFLTESLPVPHEGIEIQKYLFPDSWWKNIQPDCVTESDSH